MRFRYNYAVEGVRTVMLMWAKGEAENEEQALAMAKEQIQQQWGSHHMSGSATIYLPDNKSINFKIKDDATESLNTQ